MEEIKKLLEENEDCSYIWSDESSVHNLEKYSDDVLIFKTFNTDLNSNTLTSKKRSGKERLPTRRPDPNIYNRNALLARENRRKKKIYLETIEKELYLAKKANRVLMKTLRRQMKIGHRLEQENEYFKGLIGKGTDRLGICQHSKIPTETEVTKPFSESSSLDSLNFLSFEKRHDLTNCIGSKLGDGTGSIDVKSVSNENDNMKRKNGNHFDNLINQALPIHKNVIEYVNNDHCYVLKSNSFKMHEVNYQTDECFNLDEICLHGTHGEFCEIFCPTCILNTEFRTPPLQLLSDN